MLLEGLGQSKIDLIGNRDLPSYSVVRPPTTSDLKMGLIPVIRKPTTICMNRVEGAISNKNWMVKKVEMGL
jgi:hypothetical protein